MRPDNEPGYDYDPLAWLSEIFWPDASARLQPIDAPARAIPGSPLWWASPSADEPQILIPADSDRAAQAAVRRYHDGFGPQRRLRSLTAEATMRLPAIAERVLSTRLVGVVGDRATADARGVGGLLDGLGELLQVDDLRVAMTLARPKSNQKPVLQLLDREGRLHGWAKIGWNDWTDDLVGTEANWLANGQPLPPLAMPSLLHDAMILGQRVVVTSGFSASRLPSRRGDVLPPVALFHSVAELGDRRDCALAETSWLATVHSVLDAATSAERRAIESVLGACEDRVFRVGAWHGDLAPWNLMTANGMSQVIDWEFAANDVPFGFDLCHFHTQVGVEMKAKQADEALAYSARLTPQGLAKLGVDADNQMWVFRLYLVELARRTLALRKAERDTAEVAQGFAALTRLNRLARTAALQTTTSALPTLQMQ